MEYDSSTSNYGEGDNGAVFGETKLIEKNKELFERVMAQGNGNVTFYKAAHHGSKTSSSEKLINYIRPEYVVIPGVAGSLKHKHSNEDNVFPATLVCERLFKYTDKIYMPEYLEVTKDENGIVTKKEALPYFGDIHIISDGEDVNVTTSKNQNKPVQQTTWYKQNRPYRLYVHTFALNKGAFGIGKCTLVKYGSIDILIDCGVYSTGTSIINGEELVDKVKHYCVDGNIEHFIVTHAQNDAISQIASSIGDSIFDSFNIINLYDFGQNTNIGKTIDLNPNGWYASYTEKRDEHIKSGKIASYNQGMNETITVCDKFTMRFFNTSQDENTKINNENLFSLIVLMEFYGKKLLFMGDYTNELGGEKSLAEDEATSELISNVTYYQAGFSGFKYSNSSYLLEVVNPEYTVLNAPLGSKISGHQLPDTSLPYADEMKIVGEYISSTLSRLINYTKDSKVYALTEKNNIPICGDITFSIIIKKEEVQRTSLVGSKSTVIITETDWYKNNK